MEEGGHQGGEGGHRGDYQQGGCCWEGDLACSQPERRMEMAESGRVRWEGMGVGVEAAAGGAGVREVAGA